MRATKLIGDGLYGVDLKQIGNQVYLIEINDNPNIDAGYEDRLMGDDLYRPRYAGLPAPHTTTQEHERSGLEAGAQL